MQSVLLRDGLFRDVFTVAGKLHTFATSIHTFGFTGQIQEQEIIKLKKYTI